MIKELVKVSKECIDEADHTSPYTWAIAIALVECGYRDPNVDLKVINVTDPKTGDVYTFRNNQSLIDWQIKAIKSLDFGSDEDIPNEIFVELDYELAIARII